MILVNKIGVGVSMFWWPLLAANSPPPGVSLAGSGPGGIRASSGSRVMYVLQSFICRPVLHLGVVIGSSLCQSS